LSYSTCINGESVWNNCINCDRLAARYATKCK